MEARNAKTFIMLWSRDTHRPTTEHTFLELNDYTFFHSAFTCISMGRISARPDYVSH